MKKHNNYFDGLLVTGMHKAIFFIIMMAYFFEQMDNWNFGFIAPAIFKSWGLVPGESNLAMAHIIFWYFIGMTSGGFLGGVISDFIGRRRTFLFAILLFSSCSVINGLPIDSLPLFIAARSLTGFGVFCLMVCSQTYIAEMAPAESRGKWQGLVAAVGFCAVPVIAFLCRIIVPLSHDAWRWIFYFGGIGFVGFAIALKYLKESPRWLVSQGRVAEAEGVIKEITGQDIDLCDAANCVAPKISVREVLAGMFTRKYIGRTVLLLAVFITITPAGFTFTSWTGKLLATIPVIDPATGQAMLDAAGAPLMLYDQATMLTIMTLISCGVPAGCYLASLISDKGGRKIPLAITYMLAAVMALLFAHFSTNFAMVALCGFLLSVFNMAGGFILFSYTAESYPTQMRNTAVGTHNGIARLSVSAFQYAIPVILSVFGGTVGLVNYDIPAIFTTCAVLFFLPAPLVLFFGQKTGGKSLEEIS
jgi:putative MFS transporter